MGAIIPPEHFHMRGVACRFIGPWDPLFAKPYVTTTITPVAAMVPRNSSPAAASALNLSPSRILDLPLHHRILYGWIFIPLQMTTGPMRRFSSSARTQLSSSTARSLTAPRLLGLRQYQRTITDIRPRQASVSRTWFTSSSPCLYPELDERERQRLAERNLKLGNSMLLPLIAQLHNGLLTHYY